MIASHIYNTGKGASRNLWTLCYCVCLEVMADVSQIHATENKSLSEIWNLSFRSMVATTSRLSLQYSGYVGCKSRVSGAPSRTAGRYIHSMSKPGCIGDSMPLTCRFPGCPDSACLHQDPEDGRVIVGTSFKKLVVCAAVGAVTGYSRWLLGMIKLFARLSSV